MLKIFAHLYWMIVMLNFAVFIFSSPGHVSSWLYILHHRLSENCWVRTDSSLETGIVMALVNFFEIFWVF